MLVTELPAEMTYMEKPDIGTVDNIEYSRLENAHPGRILMYKCPVNCKDCVLPRKLICPACMSEFGHCAELQYTCKCGAVLQYCSSFCVWVVSIPIIKRYPEDII